MESTVQSHKVITSFSKTSTNGKEGTLTLKIVRLKTNFSTKLFENHYLKCLNFYKHMYQSHYY